MPTSSKLLPRPWLLLLFGMALIPLCASAGVEVQVRGLEGVLEEEAIAANVLAYLSFERYKNSDDLSPEFVERLQERSEREVRAALRPFGYYDPAVVSQVVRKGSGNEQNYLVTMTITPGQSVVVGAVDVQVTGAGATDQQFSRIVNDLPIRTGDRLNHSKYEKLKGDLLRTAATYGYLDARMLRNEMLVDPPNHSADVVIHFDTGAQYRFGHTTISQDVIDEKLVRRYVRYEENTPFDAGALLRTQFALDDSQYFSTVEVLPEDRDRDTLTVPISVVAQPNRRDRYQFGIGYGTDTEVRGTAAWENRRVNRRGHRFRTEAKAAALEQSLDARYMIPIGDPAVENFTMAATGEHERRADVDDRNASVIPSITHVRGSWFGPEQAWQRVTYVELLRTDSRFVTSGRRDEQTLLIPGISFSLVPPHYLGEALFSRTLYGELRGSHQTLGSDSDFLQVRLQAERVFDIAPQWHVLLRANVGATAVSRTSTLAPSQRFFAGGDRSVRGFGVDDLSPVEEVVDDNGDTKLEKVGGKHLLTASVELIRDLRWRNFSVAVFSDAGNAFNMFGDPLMYSVGLGFRLRLPVVSVGIDVAQALTIPPGSTERPGPRLHLNISPKL